MKILKKFVIFMIPVLLFCSIIRFANGNYKEFNIVRFMYEQVEQFPTYSIEKIENCITQTRESWSELGDRNNPTTIKLPNIVNGKVYYTTYNLPEWMTTSGNYINLVIKTGLTCMYQIAVQVFDTISWAISVPVNLLTY